MDESHGMDSHKLPLVNDNEDQDQQEGILKILVEHALTKCEKVKLEFFGFKVTTVKTAKDNMNASDVCNTRGFTLHEISESVKDVEVGLTSLLTTSTGKYFLFGYITVGQGNDAHLLTDTVMLNEVLGKEILKLIGQINKRTESYKAKEVSAKA